MPKASPASTRSGGLVGPMREFRTEALWDHAYDAQLASALMSGEVKGVVRDSILSPDLLATSKDMADQIFLKLLRKEFKDGSYYRTVIAHISTTQQSSHAIQNAMAAGKAERQMVGTKAGRTGKAGGKQANSPDACVCMARVHGQELEITCLVTPTPEEEFQLELISQNMAYRVKETCIRLASANLEQMLREIARLQRGKGSESRADELLELEKGSGVEIVGLVGAPKHNGRQGTVGNYDAGKQRYAVSLPTCHLSGGESLPAKKLAVKAANLLPLLTTASRGDEPEGITATLWAIESKGTLLSWPGGSSGSGLGGGSCHWEPEGPLPACFKEKGLMGMQAAESYPRPRTLVGEAKDGTRIQMQLDVTREHSSGATDGSTARDKSKRKSCVSKPELKVMDVDELNASRLRLQLTEVIPKLEITAAEKAAPAKKTADISLLPSGSGSDGRVEDNGRLWHSKHFVWYRLPQLKRLNSPGLVDGVFGPTIDQSKGEHGVPEDALMIEAFHDAGSGKLYLEATPAREEDSAEPCMMQLEVLGYMRELARAVTLPASMGVHTDAALAVQLRAMQARSRVMMQSDVEDARYDYEQQRLNHIMGERMCMQAWTNLVWLLEWGIQLDNGEEWLLSSRGVAGGLKPSLDGEGEGENEMEWAPVMKACRWDFPPETIGRDQNGCLRVCRLSIAHQSGSEGSRRVVKFTEPEMANNISMVAADTLRLMLIIFEVLGDSIVGMSKQVPTPTDENRAARPATAPAATRSKKKGKKKKHWQQVETMGAAEQAAKAENQRLESIKALQRRFVELHVAEKTRARKDHLLSLYSEHKGTQQGNASDQASGSTALLSVEETAEMDVMGGKREVAMENKGGNNVLLTPDTSGMKPTASKAELDEIDAERCNKVMEIMQAKEGVVAHSVAQDDSELARVIGRASSPSRRDGSTVKVPEIEEAPNGKVKLHSDTKDRIKAMCAEMSNGAFGGAKDQPRGSGGRGGSDAKKQRASAPYKLTVARQHASRD